jgi:serine/threonine protein kinase
MSDPTPTDPAAKEGQLFRIEGHTYSTLRALEPYGVSEQWLAQCHTPGGPKGLVVLQRLHATPWPEDRRRFLEEARVLQLLNHPNTPRMLAVAPRSRRPVLVLEHAEGLALERILNRAAQRRRPLSAEFAAFVASEIADALHATHTLTDEERMPLHVVHRAVSPRNIHVSTRGEVKLTGFGAVFTGWTGRAATHGPLLKGEVAYAAPEVLRQERADARADLFSLGLVLLELLTNCYLLDLADEAAPIPLTAGPGSPSDNLRAEEVSWTSAAELAARAARIRPEDVARVAADIPAFLRAVVQRALSVTPAERYPSAAAMRDELRAWLAAQPRPYGAPELVVELRRLVSTAPRRREGMQSSGLPVPAEFRRGGGQRH